mmetsp:Transcript_39231/g.108028  ORF Transcript_39231/g.108028 Transcript_39231/m.108028 type:complete len:226 (-) Transcript_39231:39-716(-)
MHCSPGVYRITIGDRPVHPGMHLEDALQARRAGHRQGTLSVGDEVSIDEVVLEKSGRWVYGKLGTGGWLMIMFKISGRWLSFAKRVEDVVLQLTVKSGSPEDLCVHCTNLGGEDVCSFAVGPDTTLCQLRADIACKLESARPDIDQSRVRLRLLTSTGRMISSSDGGHVRNLFETEVALHASKRRRIDNGAETSDADKKQASDSTEEVSEKNEGVATCEVSLDHA